MQKPDFLLNINSLKDKINNVMKYRVFIKFIDFSDKMNLSLIRS